MNYSAQKWTKIKAVFNQAVEMPTLERRSFLYDFCDETAERLEVEKLLVFADDENDQLESNAFEILSDINPAKIPERIGNYKIIREIGRGGMGAVYEAVRETDDFRQRVALKIIKRGMDTDAILSRFRHEQKILASLEHPFIARFLDGGMTEYGLPFYAMEYVEGRFIDDFCREENLSVEETLKLFRQVCSAVQYAHQNLVIHRDLKPKNVLVCADGTPKLLDFGIGKVLTPEAADEIGTATQLGMMTPAYASPEQIRGGRIGTTSDVYSLGVILYELLTGQKPYKLSSASQIEIERAVLETEPLRPSSAAISKFKIQNSNSKTASNFTDRESEIGAKKINSKSKIQNPKSLRGDLDNIILKSLRKEPENRYVSVQEFSEDIQRHLVGMPVSARPLTFGYRAGKFFERNKATTIAGVFVFLSLCAGISIALWQAHEARLAKSRAENRFAEVRQLANNVVFKYHDAIAELQGSTAVREMLVKDALRYLDKLSEEASGDFELQKELARAYLKLGDVQGKMYAANIGDTEGASESYQKSVVLLEEVARQKADDIEAKEILIQAYDSFAFLMLRTGNSPNAKEVVEKALALHFEIGESVNENEKRTLQLIELFIRLGDVDVGNQNERVNGGQNFTIRLNHHLKALPLIENLLQTGANNPLIVKTSARVHQRIGTDYFWLGDQAKEMGEREKAIEFYRKAFDFHRKMFAFTEKLFQIEPNNVNNRRYWAVAHLTLARTLVENDKSDEALQLAEKAREMYEEMLRSDAKNRETKFDLSELYQTFSSIYLAQKQYDPAIVFMQKKLAVAEEVYRADAKNTEASIRIFEAYQNLAQIFETKGDAEKAKINRRKAEDWQKIRAKI